MKVHVISKIIKYLKSKNLLKQQSFIEKIGQIAYGFRKLYYINLKIAYVEEMEGLGEKFLGYDYIIFNPKEKHFWKIDNNRIKNIAYKMYELNTNEYYIIATKKAGKLRTSLHEKMIIRKVIKNIYGCKGIFVINDNKYSSFTVKKNKIKRINKNKLIDVFAGLNPKKEMLKNPFLKIIIRCELDLVKLIREISSSKKFSILVCIDKDNDINCIKEIYHGLLNQPSKILVSYIINVMKTNRSNNAYLFTMSRSIFEKMEEIEIMEKYKINCVAYNIINDKVNILDTSEKEKKDLEEFYKDYEKELIFKEEKER